jgi:hypothetical protein
MLRRICDLILPPPQFFVPTVTQKQRIPRTRPQTPVRPKVYLYYLTPRPHPKGHDTAQPPPLKNLLLPPSLLLTPLALQSPVLRQFALRWSLCMVGSSNSFLLHVASAPPDSCIVTRAHLDPLRRKGSQESSGTRAPRLRETTSNARGNIFLGGR